MHIRYFCCNAYTKYSFISIKRFRRRRFVSSKKKRKKERVLRMAKLGEEDPRWIVSDRPDGTNINGWHWEETNKMTFCKDYFESRLNTEQNVSFGEKWFRLVSETFGNKSNVVRKFSISNASVEGECSVSTRKKGKKFGVFDLKVTMQYEVEVECMVKTKKKKKKEEENVDGLDGEEEEEEKEEEETKACAVKGEISLKEFSSLNEAEEYEWTTKTTGGEEEAKAIVKTWFTRPVLEKMFAETLETFVEKMNEFCAE